jgi:hypothetical protein
MIKWMVKGHPIRIGWQSKRLGIEGGLAPRLTPGRAGWAPNGPPGVNMAAPPETGGA